MRAYTWAYAMINVDFDTEVVSLHRGVMNLLGKYRNYIMEFVPHTDNVKLAQYILHTKTCNSFISSTVLCMNGLHIESYNATRTALEHGWLGILLSREADLAFEWLTAINKGDLVATGSRYKKTLGRPQWIREQLTKNDQEEKKIKDGIYGILSTKSHANVASTFYISDGLPVENHLVFYEPGGINSSHHKYKNLKGIKYCFEYLICDLQKSTGIDFGVEWKYDDNELFNISEIAYPDGKGGIEVHAHKVNEAFQAILLRYLATVKQL